jgi:phenylalanyl-tRNA synthetase alpha subunit
MFWNKKPENVVVNIKLDESFKEPVSLLRIFLANYLTGKEDDLKKLKRDLLQPLVEQNWDKTNAQLADKINTALKSKGEKIRLAWEQYKGDLLVAEREGKETQLIKAKLEVLEKLVEEVNVKETKKPEVETETIETFSGYDKLGNKI